MLAARAAPLELTCTPFNAPESEPAAGADAWREDGAEVPAGAESAADPDGFADAIEAAPLADFRWTFEAAEEPLPAHRVLMARLDARSGAWEDRERVCAAPRAALVAVLRLVYANNEGPRAVPFAAQGHEAALATALRVPDLAEALAAMPPLLQHTAAFLGSDRFADASVEALEDPQAGEPIPVHRVILSGRSQHFRAVFGLGLQEQAEGRVRMPDLDPPTLRALLSFVYSRSPRACLDPDLIVAALIAADRFAEDALVALIVRKIELHVDEANVCSLLALGKQLSCAPLERVATSYAIVHLAEVENSAFYDVLGPSERARLRFLSTTLVNNPLGPGVVHDLREYIGMLKEALQQQEERLAEARALHDEQRALLLEEVQVDVAETDGSPLFERPRTRRELNANGRGERWWYVDATIRRQADRVEVLRQYVQKQKELAEMVSSSSSSSSASSSSASSSSASSSSAAESGPAGAALGPQQAAEIMSEVLRHTGIAEDAASPA